MSLLNAPGPLSRPRKKVTTYGKATRKRHRDLQETEPISLRSDDDGPQNREGSQPWNHQRPSSREFRDSDSSNPRLFDARIPFAPTVASHAASDSKGLLRSPTSLAASEVSISAKTSANEEDPAQSDGSVIARKRKASSQDHSAVADASPEQPLEFAVEGMGQASKSARRLKNLPPQQTSSLGAPAPKDWSPSKVMSVENNPYRQTERLEEPSMSLNVTHSSIQRGKGNIKTRQPSSPGGAVSYHPRSSLITENKAKVCKAPQSPSRKVPGHDRARPPEFTSPGGLRLSNLQLSCSDPDSSAPLDDRGHDVLSKFRQTANPGRDEKSIAVGSNRGTSQEELAPGVIRESQETITKLTKGPKITYAARSRTVMMDSGSDPFSLLTSSNVVDLPQQPPRRELPVSDAQTSSSAHDFGTPHSLHDIPSGPLRSVRELRQAGISARMERETEALFDDLGACTTLSQRQTAVLDLALKAQSEPFLNQLGTNDIISRLFSLVGETSDWLCRALLASTITQAVSSISAKLDLSMLSSPLGQDFFVGLLDDPNDLTSAVRHHKPRFSKDLLRGVSKLCNALLDSAFWRFEAPQRISPRSIALQCLDTVAHGLQQNRAVIDKLIPSIVETLHDTLSSNHLNSAPRPISEALLSLSILEVSTLGSTSECSLVWRFKLARLLGEHFSIIRSISADGQNDVWSGALRVSLNITNNDKDICHDLSKTSAIDVLTTDAKSAFLELSSGEWGTNQDLKLDNLVLSLGVLINLAENSDCAREGFRQSRLGDPPPIDDVLQLFLSRVEDAFEVSFGGPIKIWLAHFLRSFRKRNLD